MDEYNSREMKNKYKLNLKTNQQKIEQNENGRVRQQSESCGKHIEKAWILTFQQLAKVHIEIWDTFISASERDEYGCQSIVYKVLKY